MSTSTLTVTEVDTAIRTVLKYQRYRLMDRDYTFADLEDLMEMRDKLLAAERCEGNLFMPVRFQPVGS